MREKSAVEEERVQWEKQIEDYKELLLKMREELNQVHQENRKLSD